MANVFTPKIERYSKFAIKFAIGSMGSYFLNIFLTFFFTEVFDIYYVFSFTITQLFLVIYSFTYNLRILFPSGYSHSKLIKFACILCSFSVLNILTVKNITPILDIHYTISIALSVAFFVGLKYLCYKLFVFND